MSEKETVLAKITTIFIGKPFVNFWITLRKFRDLSGNFDTMLFYKSMKKYFSKNFCKKYQLTFGKLLSQLVKAMINCLLTRLSCTVPGFTSRCSFHTALASSGCVKDLRLVNHLVRLSHLVSKQLLSNNKFYALLDQIVRSI